MKNRDGTYSSGYFGSSDMLDDLMIEDNGHIADAVAWDLGLALYLYHRVSSNLRTAVRRLRRWWLT